MADTNPHKGHRQRTREEFLQSGLSHFPPHRVLEMALYYTISRADTNPIAHALIERFGSLSGVLDAPPELLMEVDGVGRESAIHLKFLTACFHAYMEDYASAQGLIADHEAAKEYMRYKFIGEARECVFMACMGHNGKVLFCRRVADGSPETVRIVPSELVKIALRANAVKALLAHNHPHGFCIASHKDVQATALLYDALKQVDVELVDHIIIGADGVYSMDENGMFPRS